MLPPDADDFDAVTTLLEYVVDSFEKLEVLVYLYRIRPRPLPTRSIGRDLQLAPDTVSDVLAALERAGVVRVHCHADDAGWWFDPGGVWTSSVDVLVELYDIDRTELLGFIEYVALQSFQLGAPRMSTVMFARRRRQKPALVN